MWFSSKFRRAVQTAVSRAEVKISKHYGELLKNKDAATKETLEAYKDTAATERKALLDVIETIKDELQEEREEATILKQMYRKRIEFANMIISEAHSELQDEKNLAIEILRRMGQLADKNQRFETIEHAMYSHFEQVKEEDRRLPHLLKQQKRALRARKKIPPAVSKELLRIVKGEDTAGLLPPPKKEKKKRWG